MNEWMNIFIDLYMLYIVSYNQINFKMPHVIQFSLFLSLSLSLSLSFSLILIFCHCSFALKIT